MKLKTIHGLLGAALALSAATATAQCANIADSLTVRPYALNISDSTLGLCSGVSAKTAEQFFDSVKSANIGSLFPGANTTTDGISVAAAFNSLPVNLSFAPSSSSLAFSIPGLNVDQVFTGANRDASMDLLEDYLKKNDILGKILNYQAKNSPFSPITGQGGLIPTTLGSDFSSSFTDIATNIAAPAGIAAEGKGNLIGAGISYGNGKIGDMKTSVVHIPLSYTFRNDIDPRRQLVFQLPITYSELDGAKSLQGGLGVAYRFPMSDNWTLTPGVKLSFVGSADLATVAGLYSATLASTYIMEMGGFDLAIGNMVGIYKTAKFASGDYSFNPDISTTGMRNGIMLSQPVTLGGSKMSIEYSLIDARYFGDKPFADSSQEVNVTLGTNKSAFSARSFIRGGLGYVRAKDSNMVKVNVGYWF
jgi:hypothetical protein